MTYSIVGLDVSLWDGPWMSRQQILTRMAKRHRVVYSRGAWFTWNRFTPLWNEAPWTTAFEDRDGVRLHRRSKLLMRVPRIPALDRAAVRRVAHRLGREAGFDESRPRIAYVFHPSMYPYAKALDADLLVYHAYDQFAAYPGSPERDRELEKELVEDADIVIAMSNLIGESLRRYADRPIEIVPNGADFSQFGTLENGELPPGLQAVPAPRIAYFGNLSEKVDIALLERIARARPDVSMVLVGGERLNRPESKAVFESALALPNVYWLGHKDYAEVPRYMHHMDANLLAYRVGEGLWSEACSPLKLYEYLAVGKPIVSTPIEIVQPHADVLAVAGTDDEWLAAVDAALSTGGQGAPDSRRAVARANTWDARIETLESLIANGLSAKGHTR